MKSLSQFLCGMVCLGLLLAAGCSGGGGAAAALASVNATNPQRLANLYAQYQRENGGRGPKSDDTFRQYIAGMNPVLLKRIDVDPEAIDDLFLSQRDGQPLKVRYGVHGNDRSDPEPIVFEEVGLDGKRLVAFTGQKVEEVSDEAEYLALLERK